MIDQKCKTKVTFFATNTKGSGSGETCCIRVLNLVSIFQTHLPSLGEERLYQHGVGSKHQRKEKPYKIMAG